MPAIRATRADRCARRAAFVPPTAVAGSDLWFAQSALAAMTVSCADSSAALRNDDEVNVALNRASYVTELMHVQFTGTKWWQYFVPWAENSFELQTSVRRHLWTSRHNSHGWRATQRVQYIAKDTATKVHTQLAEVAQMALRLDVSGPLSLQCELIVNGSSLVDAAEVVELATTSS